MKRLMTFICFAGIFLSAALAHATEVRRFALLVGANDGGAERPTLRFAESDARKVGAVLSDMGGVARQDEIYALSPDATKLDLAFDRMQKKLAAAREDGVRLELIAFYSGHSDEFGLLLGGERYDYTKFRANLEALPADVRIIVVDSCASGALIRSKGGTRRPSFLVDSSNEVKGQAIVTSSSIDEAAQESDDLGSSYFTHFLVSGLRGGADRNHDSRVTLSEAYEFAFANTLQVTNGTVAGPQHAAYDFELSGHGDLVLTMFTPTTSTLELGDDIVGRVYVWTAAEKLVVEVAKSYGEAAELGLAPGKYTVTVARNGEAKRADVELPKVGRRKLNLRDFEPYELAQARVRGSTRSTRKVEATTSTSKQFAPLPWYRTVLLPTAGVGIAGAIGFLVASRNARNTATFYLSETYLAERRGELAEADEYVDQYFLYDRRNRTFEDIALVSGGIGVAALLTEVGFRIFSPRNVTLGLGPPGGRLVFTAKF